MDRRKFIAGAGGVMLAGQTGQVFAEEKLVYPSKACRPTPRQTQGPYRVPGVPQRSDIRDGSAGVPLKLELSVVDDLWCKPVSDFTVEIWHCDAGGYYSGVDNIVFDPRTLQPTGESIDMTQESFLRGYQVTDEQGKVEFSTIYPGWYMPRLAHIHVRLTWRDVDWTSLDTQLYLPTDVEQAVYQTAPYVDRGPNPIDIDRDVVAKGDRTGVRALTAKVEKDGDGLVGRFRFAATAL